MYLCIDLWIMSQSKHCEVGSKTNTDDFCSYKHTSKVNKWELKRAKITQHNPILSTQITQEQVVNINFNRTIVSNYRLNVDIATHRKKAQVYKKLFKRLLLQLAPNSIPESNTFMMVSMLSTSSFVLSINPNESNLLKASTLFCRLALSSALRFPLSSGWYFNLNLKTFWMIRQLENIKMKF